METPDWAAAVVEDECARRGITPPMQRWHQTKHEQSSGHHRRPNEMYPVGLIHMSAGTHHPDQWVVLLHELAHHIREWRRPRKRHVYHDKKFWLIAWELFFEYRVEWWAARRGREGEPRESTRFAPESIQRYGT